MSDDRETRFVMSPGGQIRVTIPLREANQANILAAFGLEAWQVGLAPVPRRVRWMAPLRRAWLAVTDRRAHDATLTAAPA